MILHHSFKLFSKSFTHPNDLIAYLEQNFETEVSFVRDWFNEEDYISVQTSGSTGAPKTLQLSKQDMIKSAEATALFFNLPSKTRALHCLPTQFIAGKMMWVRALHLGWHLSVVPPTSRIEVSDTENFDFVAMIPLQVENSFHVLTRFKNIIIGGAPLSTALELRLSELSHSIYVTYGMTETITHIAVRKVGEEPYHVLPHIRIGIDFRNCLQIKTPYTHREITTNDVVKLIDNQSFIWLGRIDNVINTGGIKIFPELTEQKLQPFIPTPFIIAGISDQRLGQKVVLIHEIVEEKPDFPIIFSKAGLSKFEIPKVVFELDTLSYTINNKIDRIYTVLKINK